MDVTILGGTGRTGVPLVERAMGRGHRVRVLARDRAKAQQLLPVGHEQLEIVEGDAVDAGALAGAVAGADAVIDVTGPVKGGPKDLRSQVTRPLLAAMQRAGVRRLILLTGAGVRVPGDQPKVTDRAIRGAMRLLQPQILADGQAAVDAVTGSQLDWTVVRVPRLTDGEARGRTRAAAHVGSETGTTLGRHDLAQFLLDELERGTWSRQAPVVSW